MSVIKVNTIQHANGTTALTIAANGQLSSVNTAVANVTTLNATSGVLATQNGMTGIAKAWVNFNGSTSTILGSFNVSSITRNATADYTVTYTTAMPNANYTVFSNNVQATSSGSAHLGFSNTVNGSPYYQAPTTTTCRCSWWKSTAVLGDTDVENASILIVGA